MSILRPLFGGWGAVARLYPDREIEIERTYSESSLYFGGSLLGSYRSCISVSVGPMGLRLRVPVISSSWMLPPIVIGWTDIERCDLARFGLYGDALNSGSGAGVIQYTWGVFFGSTAKFAMNSKSDGAAFGSRTPAAPNKHMQPDPAITSLSHAERSRRGAADVHR